MQESFLRCTMRIALCGFLLSLMVGTLHAAEPFSPARIAVYFSPNGGATEAVVRELNAAQTQVLMQAYSFTSAPIAKALVEAHKRGVKILAVLDKSNETAKYSAATFLYNFGLQPLLDAEHAIAHSKVLVIDSTTIITGSFNFTKAAEEKNAENMRPRWGKRMRRLSVSMPVIRTLTSGRRRAVRQAQQR